MYKRQALASLFLAYASLRIMFIVYTALAAAGLCLVGFSLRQKPVSDLSLIHIFYALTSKPEDALGMLNAVDFRTLFYLDVYFKGEYSKASMIYLEEHNMAPVIEEGDLDLFKEGYSDFLAFNYYSSDCARSAGAATERTEQGVNWTGKKGEIE